MLLVVKNPPADPGNIRDLSLIPGSGKSPGGRHGNPGQYSCLENSMDRGVWRATVHGVSKSWTRLKRPSMQHGSMLLCQLKKVSFLLKLLFCERLQCCHVFLCGLISNGARYVFFLSCGFIWEVILDVFIAEDCEPMWVHYIPSMVTPRYLVGCTLVR